MIDGFYSIYYTGSTGVGMGMLILRDGQIVGADVTGGTYEGSFRLDKSSEQFEGEIELHVPANVPMVTGAPPQPQPYSFSFTITVKLTDPDAGMTFPITLPTGPVNVAMRRLRKL